MKHTIDVITMGCSKNLVDSENLMRQFERVGYTFYHNPETLHGDITVVNTCGFIGDAKEESIAEILELCNRKEEGEIERIFVMGCLSERYRQELQEEIPEVDRFYGKFDWKQMVADLEAEQAAADSTASGCAPCSLPHSTLHTTGHFAYIKISEGCNRKCAYCAIPLITGPHKSRPMEDILDEVERMVADGVHEFQIIAQELTFYGIDLYHEQKIAELIERMAHIPGVEWIRLHYAYPAQFPFDLLRVIRENDNVCKYLDLALQHISDHMLDRMQRHISKAETLQLIETIRQEVPGICLRTTLMVGFPGETDEDFHELLAFTRQVRFERMGAFAYSEEEGTYAALNYSDDIPEEVKQQRLEELMALQQEISADILSGMVGKEYRITVDRREGDWLVGRTEYDSPEVDCEVLLPLTEGAGLEPGTFHNVRITRTEEFDLYGEFI